MLSALRERWYFNGVLTVESWGNLCYSTRKYLAYIICLNYVILYEEIFFYLLNTGELIT